MVERASAEVFRHLYWVPEEGYSFLTDGFGYILECDESSIRSHDGALADGGL